MFIWRKWNWILISITLPPKEFLVASWVRLGDSAGCEGFTHIDMDVVYTYMLQGAEWRRTTLGSSGAVHSLLLLLLFLSQGLSLGARTFLNDRLAGQWAPGIPPASFSPVLGWQQACTTIPTFFMHPRMDSGPDASTASTSSPQPQTWHSL